MNAKSSAIANGIVRLWTVLYTTGLPPERRDARRCEIESDLWEADHDPDASDAWAGLRTLTRLLRGMADDVVWRHEQEAPVQKKQIATAMLGAGCGALALWLGVTSGGFKEPVLPPAPRPLLRAEASLPPPPPPGPPPSVPGSREPRVTFKYGRTSYSALDNGPRPRKIKDVPPIQPPIAVTAGVNGIVALDAVIDEAGRVRDARVIASIPLLDQAAVDAVRQWRFEPPRFNGQPVATTIRIVVHYEGET